MITHKIFFLIANILLFLPSLAQNFFHKVYDYNQRNNYGRTLLILKDNNFILNGASSSPLTGYVSKIDNLGNKIWEFEFDYTTGVDGGYSIINVSENSFVICGTRYDSIENATDIFLFKLNQNGDSIWYKTIDIGYNDWAFQHELTSDGGFIIGGYRNVIPTPSFLIKTDSAGAIEWYKEYNEPDSTAYSFYAFDKTIEGGYIIFGNYANQQTQDWDWFLIKTNSAGNEIWKKYYGTPNYDGAKHAITTLDGGYIMAGYTEPTGDYDAYLIKTDSGGNIEWTKTYGAGNLTGETVKVIRQLNDSSYIVACGKENKSYSPSGRMVWLMHLDKNGNIIWEKFYEYYSGPGKQTYVEDLKLTSDGGFVMTGYIINNSLPQMNDVWVLKTDSLGNVCTVDSTNWSTGCSFFDCNYVHAGISTPDTVALQDSVHFLNAGAFSNHWHWDFGNGATDTLENPVHIYDSAGIYYVMLAVGYDTLCYDTAYETVTAIDTLVGINEKFKIKNEEFKLYPNPGNGNIIFEYDLLNKEKGKLEIINLIGKIISEYELKSDDEKIYLNTDRFSNGVYFYKVYVNKKLISIDKLIIIR